MWLVIVVDVVFIKVLLTFFVIVLVVWLCLKLEYMVVVFGWLNLVS